MFDATLGRTSFFGSPCNSMSMGHHTSFLLFLEPLHSLISRRQRPQALLSWFFCDFPRIRKSAKSQRTEARCVEGQKGKNVCYNLFASFHAPFNGKCDEAFITNRFSERFKA